MTNSSRDLGFAKMLRLSIFLMVCLVCAVHHSFTTTSDQGGSWLFLAVCLTLVTAFVQMFLWRRER